MAASNNDTLVFTGAPNSVPAPENSLDADVIWAWISTPTTLFQHDLRTGSHWQVIKFTSQCNCSKCNHILSHNDIQRKQMSADHNSKLISPVHKFIISHVVVVVVVVVLEDLIPWVQILYTLNIFEYNINACYYLQFCNYCLTNNIPHTMHRSVQILFSCQTSHA